MTALPTNWRELPAGLELDLIIAEARGWWIKPIPDMKEPWYWVSEKGEPSEAEKGWCMYASYDMRRIIPFCSTDANAALTLSLDENVTIQTVTNAFGDTRAAAITAMAHGQWMKTDDVIGPFALAYCRAWLAYMEAQHE